LLLTIAGLLAACAPGWAAPKVDLERMTPVPADQPIPIGDFFRPDLVSSPQLNPSGTHIAALLTVSEERHSLIIYDRATRTTDVASGYGDRDIYAARWLDDHRLTFNLAGEKLYNLGLFGADIQTRLRIFPILQYTGAYVIGVTDQDPRHPLAWLRRDIETERDGGVVVADAGLETGRFIDLLSARATHDEYLEVRDQNNRHTLKTFPAVDDGGVVTSYFCDKDGALAFAVTAKEGVLTLYRLDGPKWVKCPVDLDEIEILTSGNKPGELVVLGPRQPGKPSPVQFLDAATGKLGDVLLQDSAYDFDGWFYRDPNTHEIIGANYERNGPFVKWFRDEENAIQKLLIASFEPGQIVQVVSRSRVGHRFVVRRFSDRQPPIYDWVDLDTHTAGPIKQSRPWIDPQRMQRMQVMQFKTRDGRMLDGYLTLPAGVSKPHPAPLIVLSHGGPYTRDGWGFDGEVQFLASRGYAVLQPNYRGSTGYDWLFPAADRWEFGKMHDDVTDATKAAIATKLIDRDRIAIMGGSFGGYLAIAGVADEPGMYRCAVTIDGVFDWSAMVQQAKYWQYDSGQYGWFKRHFGDPSKTPEKFAAISPLRRADQIKVPVFIAHGKDDDVVEIGQANDLISTLEKHGVPYEKLLVSREGHGMRHVANQVELYGRIETFLAQHLAPRAQPAAAANAAP
jgi:dipeptidyl aminopeptidase/acylaminoacyl peptidase